MNQPIKQSSTGISEFRKIIQPVVSTTQPRTTRKGVSVWYAGGIMALVLAIFVGTLTIKAGKHAVQ
jgi:hypothetical protein